MILFLFLGNILRALWVKTKYIQSFFKIKNAIEVIKKIIHINNFMEDNWDDKNKIWIRACCIDGKSLKLWFK